MKRSFKRQLDSLGAIFEFVEDFLKDNALDREYGHVFDLALEELFVNMVRHGGKSTHDVAIEMRADREKLTAVLTDTDVDEYNITRHKPYNQNASLEERRIGGIGIHLVHKLMDNVSYEYHDRTSRIILTKYLRDTHV